MHTSTLDADGDAGWSQGLRADIRVFRFQPCVPLLIIGRDRSHERTKSPTGRGASFLSSRMMHVMTMKIIERWSASQSSAGTILATSGSTSQESMRQHGVRRCGVRQQRVRRREMHRVDMALLRCAPREALVSSSRSREEERPLGHRTVP